MNKLRQESQYARSLIEASPDPLVTISPEGTITDVNEATVTATGVDRSQLIGSDFSGYFTRPEKARAGYLLAFAQGQVADYPLTIRRNDGKLTEVLYNASVYKDYGGNVLGVLAAARDITALIRADQYARSLIEASLDPLVTISPEGTITDVNEATVTATGVNRSQLIGSDFSGYFTQPEQARAGYLLAFAQGQVADYPLTIRRNDGKLTEVLYNASVYKDPSGNVLGVLAAARDITALIRADQYARSLIEASLDPLVTISPEGKITDVNEATVAATGVDRAQLIGSDFSGYFTQPEQARAGYLLAFAQGQVEDYPLTIRRNDGKLTEVLYNASVYKDSSGNVLGVLAAARDITALIRADQYARSLIEASPDPLVTISPDGTITDVNEATVTATGVDRAQLIGSDFSDYFTQPEQARAGYLLAFAQGRVADYPLTIRRNDGKLTEVLYNASVYKDPSGNVLGVLAAARDITALILADQYARSLIEASLDPLVTISPEGKITDVNEATVTATGVNRSQLIGSDFSGYFTQPEQARAGYLLAFAQGQVADYPLTIRRNDGKLTEVLYNATVYKDSSGKVLGVLAAARDITALIRAEDALLKAGALRNAIFNSANFSSIATDAKGVIQIFNVGAEEMLGYTAEEVLNKITPADISDPQEVIERAASLSAELDTSIAPGFEALVFKASRGIEDIYELTYIRKDGYRFPAVVSVTALRDEQEAIIGYLLIGTDNTARKLAEEARNRVQEELANHQQQLEELNRDLAIRVARGVDESRRKDQMMIVQSRHAGMGEMIGNIAHQWRQPLATLGMVLANLKAARECDELDEETMNRAIGKGNQLIQKMSTTINDFNNFFRPNKESIPFSARKQIIEAIALVASSFDDSNISIEYDRKANFTLEGFPNEYSQVLLNLLSNAKSAIVSSGSTDGRVAIALESRAGFGCIILSDNGGGIPVESLDRIFEPYFSTKPLGTGIGLYMSKMIVERSMKGSIVARNIEGGAEFTISVPLARETP
ncbi:MAG: PAS domain S-box-containing protein [Myxococcota bacterium]